MEQDKLTERVQKLIATYIPLDKFFELTERSQRLMATYHSLDEYFRDEGGLAVSAHNSEEGMSRSMFVTEGIDSFQNKEDPIIMRWENRYVEIFMKIYEKNERLHITLELSNQEDGNYRKPKEVAISHIENLVKEFYPKT